MKTVWPEKKPLLISPFNIQLLVSFKIKRGGKVGGGITVQITVNDQR